MRVCDLHVHSLSSDGSCTPSEIIDRAVEAGLAAVALCDHNTVSGVPEFLYAAEGRDITAIAGTEFSVDYNGTEVHMLGLFLPRESFAQVTDLMSGVLCRKNQSNLCLIESLQKAGFELDYDEVRKVSGNDVINRAHIAKVMVAKGMIESVDLGMKTILHENAGHYVPPKRLSVWDILDFIKSVGAVAVLAHPFLNLTERQLRDFIPEAKERGLVGMECMYSEYSNEVTEKALAIAHEFGILPSGGSDYHGDTKPHISIGTGMGNLRIPYEWALALEKSK